MKSLSYKYYDPSEGKLTNKAISTPEIVLCIATTKYEKCELVESLTIKSVLPSVSSKKELTWYKTNAYI